MGRWKQAGEHHASEFSEDLPMALALAWMAENEVRLDLAIAGLDPDETVHATDGTVSLPAVAAHVLEKHPDFVMEAQGMMDCSLGRALAAVTFKGSKWSPAWKLWEDPPRGMRHERVHREMVDVVASRLGEHPWWKANVAAFRKAANKVRTVKKVQEA